jgi:phosphoserine phosphatase RsbU/P
MTWLLHAGDDPAYAQPDFDDSKWMRIDPSETLRGLFPTNRPEVLWYRLHVKVAPNETGLALLEWNLSSAFEIYVNGEKLIHTGQVAPFKPYEFSALLLRRIPDSAIGTGSVVIAMRVHVSQLDWANTFPGFYPENLAIGEENALSDRMWLTVIGSNALGWFSAVAGLGLGIVALALFIAEPHQREYLWIFLLYLNGAIRLPLEFYRLFHNLPAAWAYANVPIQIANLIFVALTFFALLRIPMGRWIKLFLAIGAAALVIGAISSANGIGSTLSVFLVQTPQMALVAGVLPFLLITQLRRGNREAGILLVPAVFFSLTVYISLVFSLLMQIPTLAKVLIRWNYLIFRPQVGPFVLSLYPLGDCLVVLSLAIIIVLRATRTSRQQALLESEVAAAREVQQVILPEEIEKVPGFQVESAYHPAQQVGGDFFQILPAPDDALLVVIGDVAGKGLPAAMLVSVLVGAIRGVAEFTTEPAELLANLNDRLIGRGAGGFSTALVARIAADGAVEVANAGHLAPYLDGKEIELPGALPLGVEEPVHYATTRFTLESGSRLTFYSDGIVEAKNAKGELFGFERSRELSTRPVAAIVDAAKQFGQHDDMTAISITRAAVFATAA